MAQEKSIQQGQEQDFHQYYYRYFINTKTPLIANDVYAVINIDKNNTLDDLVRKFLPGYQNNHEKGMTKAYIEKEIIKPLEQAGTAANFKMELSKHYLQLKKGKTQGAKEYFKNYEIDVEKPLQHKDVYAFLNKVHNGIERLGQIVGKQDLPAKMDKDFVINEIVNPIRQGNDGGKLIKEAMVRCINSENKRGSVKQQADNTVKNFFSNYKVNKETPLWDKDIYAFLQQTGKEGRALLSEIVKKVTGNELPQGKIYKNMVINNIVKPIKDAGKNVEMGVKGALVNMIEKVQNIDVKQSHEAKTTPKMKV